VFEYPKKNPPERETQKKNINKKGRGVPNEFDNVIMVAIVITCRANEKEEERKRGGGNSYGLYAPRSRHGDGEDYTIVVGSGV
jgi:hypothetical protein